MIPANRPRILTWPKYSEPSGITQYQAGLSPAPTSSQILIGTRISNAQSVWKTARSKGQIGQGAIGALFQLLRPYRIHPSQGGGTNAPSFDTSSPNSGLTFK